MFLLEVVDCGLRGHTHIADVMGEKLTNSGGHFATRAVIALALIAMLLRSKGAITGKAIGTHAGAFGWGNAPTCKFIVER